MNTCKGVPPWAPLFASSAVLCELCARNPLEKERYVERKARKARKEGRPYRSTISLRALPR